MDGILGEGALYLLSFKKEVMKMYGFENIGSFWWILPVIMIVLCLLMMRGCMGSMMSGCSSRSRSERQRGISSDSAIEILNKRYILGEINKEEYEDKKKAISQTDV